jgi:hypothetical protein
MTTLNFGKNWESVISTTSGDGVVNITNGVLTTTSTAGSNSKITKFLFVNPGETIRVSCMAKRLSGTAIGGIAFSVGGAERGRVFADKDDWSEISCEYSAPAYLSEATTLAVDVGVFTSEYGSVKYADPRIEIRNSTMGTMRSIAAGLIGVASGVPSLNTSFVTFGISNLTYNAGTQSLTFNVRRSSGASYTSPIILIGNNGGGAAGAIPIIPKQTSYDAATGLVSIKFMDVTTGAFVNIATIASLFFFIEVRTI